MINTFYLDAESAGSLRPYNARPPLTTLSRKGTSSARSAGRSGDVIIDNGRYKNVTVKYSCAILPEDGVPPTALRFARAVQF